MFRFITEHTHWHQCKISPSQRNKMIVETHRMGTHCPISQHQHKSTLKNKSIKVTFWMFVLKLNIFYFFNHLMKIWRQHSLWSYVDFVIIGFNINEVLDSIYFSHQDKLLTRVIIRTFMWHVWDLLKLVFRLLLVYIITPAVCFSHYRY